MASCIYSAIVAPGECCLMIFQTVQRIFGGADQLDVPLPHDAARAEVGGPEHLTGLVIDFFGSISI